MIPTEYERASIWIQSWNEAELRKEVLRPLLVAQGYREVFESHGTTELGKDFVAWEEDAFGLRRNIAIVAKAKALTGDAVQVEVFRQVLQAFNAPFSDPITAGHQYVQAVWVITNQRVKSATRDNLFALFDEKFRGRIEILDLDELTQRWMKYFPLGVHGQLTRTQELLSGLESRFDVEIQVSENEQTYSFRERASDPLSDEERSFSGRIEIPDTPEGRDLMDAIQESLRSGSPVDIPGEYVRLELPQPISDLSRQLGVQFGEGLGNFHIGPIEDETKYPTLIELTQDTGEQLTLDYIEFVKERQGSEQVTLSNNHQPIPIKVTQVVDFANSTASFRISRDIQPISAHWHLRAMQAVDYLSRPGWLRLFAVDTGSPVVATRTGLDQSNRFSDRDLEFAAKMVRIERAIRRPVLVPFSDWTDDDVQTVLYLDQLLDNPIQLGSDVGFSFKMELATDAVDQVIEMLLTPARLVLANDSSVSLFGNELPLGRVQYVLMDSRAVNPEEIREQVSRATSDTVHVYVAVEAARAETRYIGLGAMPFLNEEDGGESQGFRHIPFGES